MNDILNTTLTLEYYGIHGEDNVETPDITMLYFSVPEKSTIECSDENLNSRIKTADGLIQLAKEELIKAIIKHVEKICPEIKEDEDRDEFINDYMSNNVKFFARVRVGETWTEEMAVAKVEELRATIKNAKGYREV